MSEHIDLDPHDLARVAADAVDDKRATDVVLLDVGDLLRISDVFVIGTGASKRQVIAMADGVREKLREFGRHHIRLEGTDDGEWVLVDYGDLVVHLFQTESRQFYSLERLWGDAPRIEWEPSISAADPQ